MLRLTIHADVRRPWTLEPYAALDMDELFAQIDASYDVCDDKTASDLIIPVAEWSDPYREARNIIHMSAVFAVDLDGLDPDQEATVFGSLDGISCIIYTTHSHLTSRKGGKACYRALLELDREYLVQDFPAVWTAINRLLGDQVDPATLQHPELGYYLPSAPSLACHLSVRSREPGRVLRVDDLIAQGRELGAELFDPAPARETRTRTGTAPSKQALIQQARRWGRSSSPMTANAGALAGLILAEKPSLEEGERNNRLFELAMIIAQTWPEADPGQTARAFEGLGWDHINRDREYDAPAFERMISRCQDYAEARALEEAREKVQEQGERDELLTEAETLHLVEQYGQRWPQHLIALLNKDCYLLRPDGTYRANPVPKENLFVALRDKFPVFGDVVEYDYEVATEKGVQTREKTLPAFLRDYSTVIGSVVYDWTRREPIWSPRRDQIALHAPALEVEPEGHEEIQDWLEAADPEGYLCDVLSQMPYHDRMLPVLIMTGEKASGKTLLANGISQMYGAGAPIAAHVAFGEYVAGLFRKCPIVFMDEKATDQYRREGSSLVRRFVTTYERQVNEKYQSMVTIRGFLRMIVASNHDEILATDEDMGSEDREAFAERLIHIDMSSGKEILDKYPAKYIQENWIEGRMLAQHLRYLSEHWEVRHPGRRMAVEQAHGRFHSAIASHSGITRDVLHWLIGYLQRPEIVDRAHLPIQRRKGTLRVHFKAVLDGWDHYLAGQKLPSPSKIAKAIRALSAGRSERKKIGSVYAHVIDRAQLEAAIEAYGADLDLDAILS